MTDIGPIFTEAELKINEDNREKLIDLIKSKDAIVMVGAGCSASIYPAWSQFLDSMDKLAKEENPEFNEDPKDFLKFADKVKSTVKDDIYYNFIQRSFEPKGEATLIHKLICSLPFKAITTTNYDILLENALMQLQPSYDTDLHACFEPDNKTTTYDFLRSLNYNNPFVKRRILHLHGKYDVPKSIILAESEYIASYGFTLKAPDQPLFDQITSGNLQRNEFDHLIKQFGFEWPIRRKILWMMLATRRIVFTGFSMNDPYFKKMLEFVQEDLITYKTDTHFLISRIEKKDDGSHEELKKTAKNLYKRFGIVTVFFEDNKTYRGLENFFVELNNRIPTGRNIVPKAVEDEHPSEEDIDLTEELLIISKKLSENVD